jgi:hypothetical protein
VSEDIDYAARVQRGIALLDEKWPGWATEIDLERLDISEGDRCMTAQYAECRAGYASFQCGQNLLGLSDRAYEVCGFNADGQSTGEAVDSDRGGYDTLNGLWKAEIERRRAQGQDAQAEPEATS